jgi:hypothetical protein
MFAQIIGMAASMRGNSKIDIPDNKNQRRDIADRI